MKYFILVLAIIVTNSQLLLGQVFLPTQSQSGNDNVGIGSKSLDAKLSIYNWHKPFGEVTTNPNVAGLKIIHRENTDVPPFVISGSNNKTIYPSKNIIEVLRETGVSNQLGATTSSILTLDNQGRLGLGINLPTERLHILKDDPGICLEDNITATGSPDKGSFIIRESNGTGRLISDKSVAVFLDSDNNDADDSGSNLFQIVSNSTSVSGTFKTNFRVWGNGNTEVIGSLKIGGDIEASNKLKFGAWELFQTVDNNKAYFRLNRGTQKLLAVDGQGKLYATAVKVTVTEFPDFVFDSTYQLMPLRDLEIFISQNHHLPEVPSEKEVIADGLDLGEMNKILLQKIEELTLHLIQQEKRISELEKQIKITKNEKQ